MVPAPSRKLFLKYNFETYPRSNQGTGLTRKLVVNECDWIQTGDLSADTASSAGDLAVGHIIVAYVPWEGFNYEDEILRHGMLVYEDMCSQSKDVSTQPKQN